MGITFKSRLKCVLGLVAAAGHEAPSRQVTLRPRSSSTISPGHADCGILSGRTKSLTSNASVNRHNSHLNISVLHVLEPLKPLQFFVHLMLKLFQPKLIYCRGNGELGSPARPVSRAFQPNPLAR